MENSTYCKPNLKYYREILDKIQVRPEDCLMIGNDVEEDMVAETMGMQVYLVLPCMLNPKGKDISGYRQGTLETCYHFVFRHAME